ncbi:MAG: DUF2851 family protein [Saprospiraceae bacterium]|nr:DUF2851 family protein [Saprospiraceae bacterium]
MQSAPTSLIKEELLYYVWRLKRFDLQDLQTSSGQTIQILDAGLRNNDAGPDFSLARIKLGDDTWVGHVEMHVRASDWIRHRHQDDPAFENVVLHVVYECDKQICLPNGEPLACLALQNRIEPSLVKSYKELMEVEAWIPCANNRRVTSDIALQAWYERVLVTRLEEKTAYIRDVFEHTREDWEETFYRILARNFGFKVNADAFEALAISTPRKLLIKHKDNLKQIEALLFGQAGLIPDQPQDDYTRGLQQEYGFLRKKYTLAPLESHRWKFMRMRPANFPTIRLAQFGVLIFKTAHLFSKMLAAKSTKELRQMFNSEVSWYWKDHYRFDQTSPKKSKKLGTSSIDLILINTIIPLLFFYGKFQQQGVFSDRALTFLQELKPERNRVITKFRALSFPVSSAFDSQALLQLKKQFCDPKQCLSCTIGHDILKAEN